MTHIISVGRGRLRRWLENFARRHPGIDARLENGQVCVLAADDAIARVHVPFPPLLPEEAAEFPAGLALLEQLVSHAGADRCVGAILVRKGGFAAGVFHGVELTESKTGTGYVQGKTKAGGWSQQRYARRRDQQARQLYDRAAAAAGNVLLPHIGDLFAVATGGDRAGVAAVTERTSLAPLRPLLMSEVFPVADPRRAVLAAFPDQFLAVRIELNDRA